jgi:hypothetical protein
LTSETCVLKIYTGVNAATESPAGDATNWNLQSTDAYDSTGTAYQTNKVTVPSSGTSYSYERWMRLYFSGTFNNINNVLVYKSAGSLSDSALDILAGTTTSAVTPITTVSSVATTTLTSWDSALEAIDITPGAGLVAAGYSDYFVLQLKVPSTVTTPGDIGTITITFSYDVS